MGSTKRRQLNLRPSVKIQPGCFRCCDDLGEETNSHLDLRAGQASSKPNQPQKYTLTCKPNSSERSSLTLDRQTNDWCDTWVNFVILNYSFDFGFTCTCKLELDSAELCDQTESKAMLCTVLALVSSLSLSSVMTFCRSHLDRKRKLDSRSPLDWQVSLTCKFWPLECDTWIWNEKESTTTTTATTTRTVETLAYFFPFH